ncbi:T3SS effector HopA1 family protein [Rhizobium panacihumi]|uniref:T3SS effector HopA1 family protein n=1 Tax=Rhizobium panacihumi TaxID=2008450 RepID=UPI003D7B446E
MNAFFDFRDDVNRVIAAVDIGSLTRYRIDGLERDLEKIRTIDPSKKGALGTSGDETPEQLLRKVLTTDIYTQLYNRAAPKTPQLEAGIISDFVHHLSQANRGQGAWQEGWQALGEDPATGEVVVRHEDVLFWAAPQSVRFAADGRNCWVRAGKDHKFLNAHFYMALGDTCIEDIGAEPGPLLRFFWHLGAEVAIDYMAAVTEKLNRAGIYFRTKVLSSPHSYDRSDAGVLYIHAAQLEQALPLVLAVHDAIGSRLSSAVPLFTRQIAPGLAFAEDPGNGDSFGISRSMLMADILIARAFGSVASEPDSLVAAAFRQAGLSPRHPHAPMAHLAHYETLIQNATKVWSRDEARQD